MQAQRVRRERPAAQEEDWGQLVQEFKGQPAMLVEALHRVQERAGWLPEDALRALGKAIGRNLSFVTAVASFYPAFRFRPPGQHVVQVCRGLGCAQDNEFLRREVASYLRTPPGRTSRDGMFTWEETNCPGLCAHGPVLMVDGRPYGRIEQGQARQILQEIRGR